MTRVRTVLGLALLSAVVLKVAAALVSNAIGPLTVLFVVAALLTWLGTPRSRSRR
jgi:hypothetical protein